MAVKIRVPFTNKTISFNSQTVRVEKNGSNTFYTTWGIGQDRTIRDTSTLDGQRKAYQNCPVVTSLITKKVSAASNGQRYYTNSSGKTVPVTQSPKLKKLDELLTKFDFPLAYTMNQIFGKAYIWKRTATGFNGVTSLEILLGWNVTDDKTKDFITYKFEETGGQIEIPKSDLIIWNDKYFNFIGGKKPVIGGSRLAPIFDPVSLVAAAYEGMNMIWTNGGAVGIITPQAEKMGSVGMKPDEKTAVHDYFTNKYGTKRGQNPVLISKNPIRWQSTILPIDQLGYIPGIRTAAERICDVYSISPLLLGFTDGSTFANKTEAEKAMYQDAIIPEIAGLCDAINQDKDIMAEGYVMTMDYSHVSALQQDESTKADFDAKIMNNAKIMKETAIYSDQEIRAYIEENSKLTIIPKK